MTAYQPRSADMLVKSAPKRGFPSASNRKVVCATSWDAPKSIPPVLDVIVAALGVPVLDTMDAPAARALRGGTLGYFFKVEACAPSMSNVVNLVPCSGRIPRGPYKL